MCWSAWGVDVCATFAPEYKDTVRDTTDKLSERALDAVGETVAQLAIDLSRN